MYLVSERFGNAVLEIVIQVPPGNISGIKLVTLH